MRNIDEIKAADFNAAVELLNMAAIKKMVEGIEPKRLVEICQAEREGRCVVLPCKAGDTVWDYFGMAWEITQVELYMNGRMWFRCGHKGTDDYTAFCDGDIGERIFLTEKEGDAAKVRWDNESKAIREAADARAEAEAALEKGVKQDGR